MEIRLSQPGLAYCGNYRLSKEDQELINEQTKLMLKAGVIEPSDLKYNFPAIVATRSSTKKKRLCVDSLQGIPSYT